MPKINRRNNLLYAYGSLIKFMILFTTTNFYKRDRIILEIIVHTKRSKNELEYENFQTYKA